MRRTQRAFWMTTSGESWRLLAASHQAQAGTHPSRTLQMVSQAAKWWRCPQVRVNIHPGTDSRETQATCTTTNTCTTSITQASGSPKSRWRLRRPCVCTAAFPGTQRQVIMDQSVVATQTAWDPTPWSMPRIGVHDFIIPLLRPNSFLLLFLLVSSFCYAAAKLAHSTNEGPRKVKKGALTTCQVLQTRWRKTRRSCCGWWKDKKKLFNIRGAHTGQWWQLTVKESRHAPQPLTAVCYIPGVALNYESCFLHS